MSLRTLKHHKPRRLLLAGLFAACALLAAEPTLADPGAPVGTETAVAAAAPATTAAPATDQVAAAVTETVAAAAPPVQAAAPQAPLPAVSTPAVTPPSITPAATPPVPTVAPAAQAVERAVVKTVESAAKAVPAAAAQVVAPVQDTVRERVVAPVHESAREAPAVVSAAVRAQPPVNATGAVVGTALSAPTRHPTAPRATRSTHQTSPAATSGVARPPSSGGGASQVSAVPASVPPPVAARPAPAEQGQSATSVPRARHAQQTGVLGAREARIVPSPATTPVPTGPTPIRSAVSIDEQPTPVGTKPAEPAGGRPDAPQLPSLPSALGAAASSATGAGLELPAALLAALLLVAPWLGRLPRPSPGQVRPPLYVSVLERPG